MQGQLLPIIEDNYTELDQCWDSEKLYATKIENDVRKYLGLMSLQLPRKDLKILSEHLTF